MEDHSHLPALTAWDDGVVDSKPLTALHYFIKPNESMISATRPIA